MENSNPIIYFKPVDENNIEEVDANSLFYFENRELNNTINQVTKNDVYECIKDIIDPEYPLTLEQLNVVSLENIIINHEEQIIFVFFKPTVTSCSQASLIGLSLYYKLHTVFNKNFKIIIKVVKGTHDLEDSINKQLKDKERVHAALENPQIYKTITKGLANSDIWEDQSLLY
ncbi:unnamed protein product [Cryptosporidium hominis]|uniref:MIP18 family-like domain-containing protein n=1 Tax=Cryptosporidium hominis TaxID=237895 RepID=A0A0S4TJC8_CRYHO|nr:Uncharacterized protein GY17_00002393 [Cryptosporidium hominis]CUV07496.1 unnamed protein product [Cryptosporidium hominis]|eukprot:PPS95644.1 Uncharacterized protein GY17_00002393 [Cryptosporidium hominis]